MILSSKACGLLAGLFFVGVGCNREPPWPPSPASLRAGEDSCAECRMIVSDVRFAAQWHSRDGAIEWFDDIGCLVKKHAKESDTRAVFIRTFDDEAWVRGDRGYAVQYSTVDSPMGYGWCTYATLEQANSESSLRAGSKPASIGKLLLEAHGGSSAGSLRPKHQNSVREQK